VTLRTSSQIKERLKACENGRDDRKNSNDDLNRRSGGLLKRRKDGSPDDRGSDGRRDSEEIALVVAAAGGQIMAIPAFVGVEKPAAEEFVRVVGSKICVVGILHLGSFTADQSLPNEKEISHGRVLWQAR
jgi:hypothetical protein